MEGDPTYDADNLGPVDYSLPQKSPNKGKSKACDTSPVPSANHGDSPIQPARPSEHGTPSSNDVAHLLKTDDEDSDADKDIDERGVDAEESDPDFQPCLICLSAIQDRTVLPRCLHSQFCFECIVRWTEVARRCPLCQHPVDSYVIHSIRSDDDYIRYHLRPQVDNSDRKGAENSLNSLHNGSRSRIESRRAVVERVQAARSRRQRERTGHFGTRSRRSVNHDEGEELATALAFRRQVYRHRSYAKHVGSNRFTGYKPCPAPSVVNQQFQAQPRGDLIRRIQTFVRRELQVFGEDLDVEFLTTYVVSLMRALPIGSEEMVNLLAEFIGSDNSQQFWHELEAFIRSGKLEVNNYDKSPLLQYDFTRRREARPPSGVVRTRKVSEQPDSNQAHSSASQPDQSLTSTSRSASSTGTNTPIVQPPSSTSTSHHSTREEVALRRETLLQRLEREKILLSKQSRV